MALGTSSISRVSARTPKNVLINRRREGGDACGRHHLGTDGRVWLSVLARPAPISARMRVLTKRRSNIMKSISCLVASLAVGILLSGCASSPKTSSAAATTTLPTTSASSAPPTPTPTPQSTQTPLSWYTALRVLPTAADISAIGGLAAPASGTTNLPLEQWVSDRNDYFQGAPGYCRFSVSQVPYDGTEQPSDPLWHIVVPDLMSVPDPTGDWDVSVRTFETSGAAESHLQILRADLPRCSAPFSTQGGMSKFQVGPLKIAGLPTGAVSWSSSYGKPNADSSAEIVRENVVVRVQSVGYMPPSKFAQLIGLESQKLAALPLG